MAKDDDDNGMKYKEGVDFEMVDKGGYKSRRFFTKAEKDAKNAPAPKAAAPKAKPKLQGIKTVPVTTSPLPEDTAAATMKVLGTSSRPGGARPEGKAASMPQNRAIKNYTDQLSLGS